MVEIKPVVLFDGVCNFCDKSVQFMIQHDPEGYFMYASLQSDSGQEILKKYGISTEIIDTIVLVENDRAYIQSTAALRIARKLNRLWSLLYIFIIVPPFIRNSVYRFVARNRYKWFGKKDSCMLPDPEIRSRFLS